MKKIRFLNMIKIYMVRKTIFIGVLYYLVTGSLAQAQDNGTQWGEQAELAKNKYQLFNEFMYSKNLEKAHERWYWLFKFAPRVDERIYTEGPKVIKNEIRIEQNKNRIDQLEDTLFMIYDQHIQYFGNRGKNLGKKAVEMYNRRLNSNYYDELFETVKEAVDLEKVMTHHDVLPIYFNMHLILYNRQSIDKETFFAAIRKVNEIVSYKLLNQSLYKPDYLAVREKMYEVIDRQSVVETCSDWFTIYQDIEQFKQDTHLVKSAYDHIRTIDCYGKDLFVKITRMMYEFDSSATVTYHLAKNVEMQGKIEEAKQLLEKSVNDLTNVQERADAYLSLAELLFVIENDYEKARKYIWISDSMIPSAISHELLGDIYEDNMKLCSSDTVFGVSLPIMAAIAEYEKAKEKAPHLMDHLDRKIMAASQFLPIYQEGMPVEGDRYYVDCWIKHTIPIRYQ